MHSAHTRFHCEIIAYGSEVENLLIVKSSHSEVFLRKGILKICSKFTREQSCRTVISIMSQSNFIEITFQHYGGRGLP